MQPVAARITWVVELLPTDTKGRILEIGCGGGHAIGPLLARCASANVVAIDRSPLQVERARRHVADHSAAGRVRVETLELMDAPGALGTGRFAAAVAINVNAFWTAPAPSFHALHQLLVPDGRAYLAFEPPTKARAGALHERLPQLLAVHGFGATALHETVLSGNTVICVVAARSMSDE